MKAISFSLYGVDLKYLQGMVRNLNIIRDFYPDWTPVVYCDWGIPETLRCQMSELGADIRVRDDSWHTNGMFWRFYAAADNRFSCVIFRDADSRIQPREMLAVEEWLRSGKTLHIMRDHPNHLTPILGGMWGLALTHGMKLPDFSRMNDFGNKVGEDQEFLAKFVYPIFKNKAFVHDSFFKFERSSRCFPSERLSGEYVGESFNELDDFDEILRAQLLRIEANFFLKILLKSKSIIQAKFSF